LSSEFVRLRVLRICRISERSVQRLFAARYPLLAVKSDFLRTTGLDEVQYL
jgi:hypothetical protein